MSLISIHGVYQASLHASRHQFAAVDALSPTLDVGGAAGGNALRYFITGNANPSVRLFDGGLQTIDPATNTVRSQLRQEILQFRDALGNQRILIDAAAINLQMFNALGIQRVLLDEGHIYLRDAAAALVFEVDTATPSLGIGLNRADAGTVRLPNDQLIQARNAGNTANIALLYLDTNDRIRLSATAVTISVTSPGLGINIGAATPIGRLHVRNATLGLAATALDTSINALLEATDPTLELAGDNGGNWTGGLLLTQVDGAGALVNKWAIMRRTTGGGNGLRFNFGANRDGDSNAQQAELSSAGQLNLTGGLLVGADPTATAGRNGLGVSTGLGLGVNTNLQAPAIGGGSGPASLVVNTWIRATVGATTGWIPFFV